MPFPGQPSKFTIFDSLPALSQTSFEAGLRGTNTQQKDISIIMFSPNLQIIASLDNTRSKVTSEYTVEVATGFTFGSSQSLSITTEVGVNIEVFTASVSTTFALSFTQEWSKTTTKSMTFSCPPGEKAFVYQGTLLSRVMVFNPATAIYTWDSTASKALTEVLTTSSTPIGNVPSGSVNFKQV